MTRTLVDLDDEALTLAARRLGTKTKVATVNAALREIANREAVSSMLNYLRQSEADLSAEGMKGAWR